MHQLPVRKLSRALLDGAIAALALYVAFEIRFEGQVPPFEVSQLKLLWGPVLVMQLAINVALRIGKQRWRYVSIVDAIQVGIANCTLTAILIGCRFFLPEASLLRIPLEAIAMQLFLSLFGGMSARLTWRLLWERKLRDTMPGKPRRVLLLGAGFHGATVAKEMSLYKGITVVGFLDDDPEKRGAVIAGARVLGPTSSLSEVVNHRAVDEVLVCIPPAERNHLMFDSLANNHVRTRIIPPLSEVLTAELDDVASIDAKKRHRPTQARSVAPPSLSRIRGKTILITGGAGFIGCSLAEKLASANRVLLVDVSFKDRPIQFTSLSGNRNVKCIEADLRSDDHLPDLCREAELVVHAAAVVGVNRVCNAARETMETNYGGTSRILRALENSSRVERFIYFSTSEVFGVNSYRVDENSPPSVGPIAEARWSYAIAKLAGEHLVKSYYRENRMPIVIVRPFNVFGPRRTGDHALLRFIINALARRPLEVHGDGSQIRSWCYIEDFCNAVLAMLERPEAVGEDFNIGNSANTITIHELARKVVEMTESTSPIVFVDSPFPDISIRVPTLAKANSLLGYRPEFDLESSLTATVEWYRRHWSYFGKRLEVDEERPASYLAVGGR